MPPRNDLPQSCPNCLTGWTKLYLCVNVNPCQRMSWEFVVGVSSGTCPNILSRESWVPRKALTIPSAQGLAQGRLHTRQGRQRLGIGGLWRSATQRSPIRRYWPKAPWLVPPIPRGARRRDSRAGTVRCLRAPFRQRLHNSQDTTSATAAD